MKSKNLDILLKIICWGTAVLVGVSWGFNIEEPYSFLVLPAILWLIMTPHMMRIPTLDNKTEEST